MNKGIMVISGLILASLAGYVLYSRSKNKENASLGNDPALVDPTVPLNKQMAPEAISKIQVTANAAMQSGIPLNMVQQASLAPSLPPNISVSIPVGTKTLLTPSAQVTAQLLNATVQNAKLATSGRG